MMIIHVMDVSMTSELLRISLYIGAISGEGKGDTLKLLSIHFE